MNKEEILAMNPSMQLGNLVAIEVMKWHREGDHWVAPEGFWIKAEGLDGWRPWQDISAAWQVVEKLDKDGFKFYVEPLSKSRFEVGFLPINKLNEETYWKEGGKAEEGWKEGWNELFLIVEDIAKFPGAICKTALLTTLEKK